MTKLLLTTIAKCTCIWENTEFPKKEQGRGLQSYFVNLYCKKLSICVSLKKWSAYFLFGYVYLVLLIKKEKQYDFRTPVRKKKHSNAHFLGN